MIGVATSELDQEIVREFFELFKTPWEFCRAGAVYDVILTQTGTFVRKSAKLVVIYGSALTDFDREQGIDEGSERVGRILSCDGEQMPIYGLCRAFRDPGPNALLRDQASGEFASAEYNVDDATVVRLGFDLFREIRHLLTFGQPEKFAGLPTLDRHVALLRRLIVARGLLLVEIPPVPAGYPFIVALTHDVDHPGVRFHKFDQTMCGFLYRALVGSVIGFFRGRRSLRQVRLNWQAALRLPLVFAGLAKDFWDQLDSYVQLERRVGSTFFVIPFKGEPGLSPDGRTRRNRAAGYSAQDLANELRRLAAGSSEVAVHGIDAWRDPSAGEGERRCVQAITGATELGIRMHWLYFDSGSPQRLEAAGFSYDSTIGYNATIGYRAGSSQVFKHPGVEWLVELPLHVMDTAMFYPSYMDLSDCEARAAVLPLIENATRSGGVLTINWHDRSLGPERLWGDAYRTILEDLRVRKPWFATAAQTVSWFRQRRSVSFGAVSDSEGTVHVRVASARTAADVPPLLVRIHNRRASNSAAPGGSDGSFEDFVVEHSDRTLVAA